MRLRVKPPAMPGEAAQMHALRQEWARSAAVAREADRFARDPSLRARATADRLLEAEARVLASIDATTGGSERARLTQQAADLRRMADEQLQEAQVSIMRDKAKQIRDTMKKRLGEVAQRMAQVKASDDEQFPPDFQAKRQGVRADLNRQWQAIESQAYAELAQWADQSSLAARAQYEADPIGDAATESRRVSRNLEIAGLAQPFIGQSSTMVKNHLLPEVRRFLALGNVEKAGVYFEAAKRAGVVDSRLEQALSSALDESIPHRKQALAQLREVQDERDLFDLDRYTARIAHGVGSPSEQVRNSTALKLSQWRQKEGFVATATGGAASGEGSGDGGAAGAGAGGASE